MCFILLCQHVIIYDFRHIFTNCNVVSIYVLIIKHYARMIDKKLNFVIFQKRRNYSCIQIYKKTKEKKTKVYPNEGFLIGIFNWRRFKCLSRKYLSKNKHL